jgi:hypothetical protein
MKRALLLALLQVQDRHLGTVAPGTARPGAGADQPVGAALPEGRAAGHPGVRRVPGEGEHPGRILLAGGGVRQGEAELGLQGQPGHQVEAQAGRQVGGPEGLAVGVVGQHVAGEHQPVAQRLHRQADVVAGRHPLAGHPEVEPLHRGAQREPARRAEREPQVPGVHRLDGGVGRGPPAPGDAERGPRGAPSVASPSTLVEVVERGGAHEAGAGRVDRTAGRLVGPGRARTGSARPVGSRVEVLDQAAAGRASSRATACRGGADIPHCRGAARPPARGVRRQAG